MNGVYFLDLVLLLGIGITVSVLREGRVDREAALDGILSGGPTRVSTAFMMLNWSPRSEQCQSVVPSVLIYFWGKLCMYAGRPLLAPFGSFDPTQSGKSLP